MTSDRPSHVSLVKRVVLSAVACILAATGTARGDVDAKLKAKLDEVLGAVAGSGATYVARVVEASTGRELYLHDADRAVAPASNAKLATTAAAIDRFGPDYVWRTYLAIDGDDLWIVGTGDPSCGDRRIEESHKQKRMAILDAWADALAKRGVTRVKGKLIYDDRAFDDQRVGSDWPKSELTESWCAPLSGLALNGNCVSVTAFPDRLTVVPETEGVKLVNKTRPTGKPAALSISRAADSDTFTVSGLVTKKADPDPMAVVDPGAFFADAVRTKLKAKGITIDGVSERATAVAAKAKWAKLKAADQRDDRVVAVHETPMSDVMWRTNKQSQNLFADATCKLLGKAWAADHGRDEPGNWKAGGEAVRDFLKRIGVDDSKWTLVDGSGMSHANRVTARMVSDLLLKMLKHKHADAYRATLSICGKDGTLDDRMMDIAGRVHGKSGTIDGVKALSGYLTTRNGELLVFSMIYNDAPPKVARRCANLMDDACRVMVEWPAVENAKVPATGPAAKP